MEKVNSKSRLLVNLVKNRPIGFTQEVVEKVYEALPTEQKYFTDEVGNIWKPDPVGVVRTALMRFGYQMDTAWSLWGTKSPIIIGKSGDFHGELLSRFTNIIKSKTGIRVNPESLIYKIIGSGTELEQKLFKQQIRDTEQVILFLEFMFEIQNKKGYFPGIKTDPTTFEEIKSEMIDVCYNYIFENELVPIESILLFVLFYIISSVVSDIKANLKTFNDVYNFLKDKLEFDIINKIKSNQILKIEEIVKISKFLFNKKIRTGNEQIIAQTLRSVYSYYDAYITIKDYELLKLLSSSNPQDNLLRDDFYREELEIYYYKNLIENLIGAKIKIAPERTIGILEEKGGLRPIKDDKGKIIGWSEENRDKIIWLELGNVRAGMIHILLRHKNDFADYGINTNLDIVKFILKAIKSNIYIRFEGGQLYKIINEEGKFIMYLKVVISKNGFIYTAFPYDREDPPDWAMNKLDEIQKSN